ncbi:MAG: type II toxin-antitoxin system RelE/ParE family toxin, partial [Isosphaeraceae bacterium]|nr:type II toxin-antitoxin system RelE/ParE family toxin [Isosphaeraceae bacterium]
MKGGILLGGEDRSHAGPLGESQRQVRPAQPLPVPSLRKRAGDLCRQWLIKAMSWVIRTTPSQRPSERLFGPPEWSWVQAGDVGWWVRADWREPLLGPHGLRLDEWRRRGRLTVVKTGPHRVVYRVDLDEGAVFIKHFLVPDFRAKLRQWFRRGKGRNEGRRTRYLSAIGVPTITPVALGEQRKRFFLLE